MSAVQAGKKARAENVRAIGGTPAFTTSTGERVVGVFFRISVGVCADGGKPYPAADNSRAHAHTVGPKAGTICFASEENITSGTVLHEVAHMLTYEIEGHSFGWRAVMRRMGAAVDEQYEPALVRWWRKFRGVRR